jgi:ABC-type transport system involved in cytochrome c biogenesis permease subunit
MQSRAMRSPIRVPSLRGRRRLDVARHTAAGLALAVALVYLAIAFDLVAVVDPATREPGFLLAFGLLAAGAYVLGAVLVASVRRPWVWLLGALFQFGVIVMYVLVAPERTPAFEVWGVALRLPQLAILALLALLVLRRRDVSAPEVRS